MKLPLRCIPAAKRLELSSVLASCMQPRADAVVRRAEVVGVAGGNREQPERARREHVGLQEQHVARDVAGPGEAAPRGLARLGLLRLRDRGEHQLRGALDDHLAPRLELRWFHDRQPSPGCIMGAWPPFDSLYSHGFARVAAAVPHLRPAEPAFNAERTLALAAAGLGEPRRARRLPRAGHLGVRDRRPAAPARGDRRGARRAGEHRRGQPRAAAGADRRRAAVGGGRPLQLRGRDPPRRACSA